MITWFQACSYITALKLSQVKNFGENLVIFVFISENIVFSYMNSPTSRLSTADSCV